MSKILVVDDSLFARMNICNMLEEAGHETIQAADGHEGLQKILADKPDCVLTDLLMPNLDGVGLLSELKEAGVTLPVIVLTADIQETKRQKCLALGIRGFISKPPQKDILLQAVANVLESEKELK